MATSPGSKTSRARDQLRLQRLAPRPIAAAGALQSLQENISRSYRQSFWLFRRPCKIKTRPYIASGCKAKPEICSGKNAIGRRSAISGIALQHKVEGGQRGKARCARFDLAMVNKPSVRFSDCWRHNSITLRMSIREA